MARRKPKAEAVPEEQRAPFQPNVSFVQFWVSHAEMREVAKQPTPKEDPRQYPIQMSLSARFGLSAEGHGRTALTVSAKGDARFRPYEVTVEVVGEFAPEAGQTVDMDFFCREVAPTILFPYARQVIDTLTSDGRFGALRLSPINVRGILATTEWKRNEEIDTSDFLKS